MIYLFAGDDAQTKRKAYEKFINSEYSGVETFAINRNNFNKEQIESLYSGAGLFFGKCVVVFSEILEREENREFILSKLSFVENSGNDFIFIESKLNKPILDEFRKVRAELNIFELPKEKLEKYNNFQHTQLQNQWADMKAKMFKK